MFLLQSRVLLPKPPGQPPRTCQSLLIDLESDPVASWFLSSLAAPGVSVRPRLRARGVGEAVGRVSFSVLSHARKDGMGHGLRDHRGGGATATLAAGGQTQDSR